jgi:hypothetical protein
MDGNDEPPRPRHVVGVHVDGDNIGPLPERPHPDMTDDGRDINCRHR